MLVSAFAALMLSAAATPDAALGFPSDPTDVAVDCTSYLAIISDGIEKNGSHDLDSLDIPGALQAWGGNAFSGLRARGLDSDGSKKYIVDRAVTLKSQSQAGDSAMQLATNRAAWCLENRPTS